MMFDWQTYTEEVSTPIVVALLNQMDEREAAAYDRHEVARRHADEWDRYFGTDIGDYSL